jgi:hypothetical protein
MKNFFKKIAETIKAWWDITVSVSTLVYGEKGWWISVLTELLGVVVLVAQIVIWIKHGFIASIKFYGICCLVWMPFTLISFVLHLKQKNKVKEDKLETTSAE